MLKLALLIGVLAVLGLAGAGIYVLASDGAPTQRMVEKVIPDARLPR
jgi:hypothetical protein